MRNKKVWFITGAGRGMGVDFAKAALAAGHAVVATGRDAGGQLLRGLFRGAVPGAGGSAVGDEPPWPDERHPRRLAGHAQTARGARHRDLLIGRSGGFRVLLPRTLRRSLASRAGWSRSRPRSCRSGSAPPS